MFGPEQPVVLHLIEVEQALQALGGLVMELEDCAFPLLRGVVATASYEQGFLGVQYAVLVGGMPRKDGMERSDLLKANVAIFRGQGEALEKWAARTCKVLVVANPANTNAAVCAHYAPSLPRENFSALTRLDHNRAVSLAGRHLNVPVEDVQGVCIWGNHSSTQYPDVSNATVAGKPLLNDKNTEFFRGAAFIETVQKRGAAVIAARKLSSAGSAAQAIVHHMRDWHFGTGDRIVSMAIFSGAYNVPKGVIFSYPVRITKEGRVVIVEGLSVDDFSRKMLDKTYAELSEEWNIATTFLETK